MDTTSDAWRILIVDDYKEMRSVLRMSFEAEGDFVVREAADADAAAELALSWPADAALVDWRLGEESGLDLVRRLRRAEFKGAAVMFTGGDDSDLEIRALDAGADDYVEKGAGTVLVIDVVRRLLQENRQLRL